MQNVPQEVTLLVAEFIGRIRTIPPGSKIKLFYHGDPDGVCAAATAAAVIRHIIPENPLSCSWIGTHQFDFEPIETYLSSHAGSTVFFFDLNLSSRKGFLQFLISHRSNSVTVIDDHILNGDDVDLDLHRIMLNPNLPGTLGVPISFPPSLFTYLAAIREGVVIPTWIPILGLFADRQLDKYKTLFDSLPQRDQLFEGVTLLSSIFLDPDTSYDDAFVFDYLCSNIREEATWETFIRDAPGQSKLKSAKAKIDDGLLHEVQRQKTQGPERLFVREPPIMLFKQNSIYRFTNILASTLRADFPNAVVVVYRNECGLSFFEIRAGEHIRGHSIVLTLNRVAEKIKLRNYGGHERAAGGACLAENMTAMVSEYASAGSSKVQ